MRKVRLKDKKAHEFFCATFRDFEKNLQIRYHRYKEQYGESELRVALFHKVSGEIWQFVFPVSDVVAEPPCYRYCLRVKDIIMERMAAFPSWLQTECVLADNRGEFDNAEDITVTLTEGVKVVVSKNLIEKEQVPWDEEENTQVSGN